MNETFNNLPSIEAKIAYLKDNGLQLPNIEKYNSEWDENQHRIMTDMYNYPDKIVDYSYTDSEDKVHEGKRIEKLNRIPLAYQKDIVANAVTFLYGNPVKYTNAIEEENLFDAFKKVLEKEKIVFIDREIATTNGRFTQCAELWWVDQEQNDFYGFNSNLRLKVNVLSPEKNKMFPYFDEQGNMVAFLREFEKRIDGKKVKHYEIYTAQRKATLKDGKNGIEVISDEVNVIGKIPIVWYQFKDVEWSKAQKAIERLEEIVSDVGEVNKKFSSPILGLHGEVNGSFSKDRSGKVLQFNGDQSRAEFIQPPNASESLETEKENLKSIIYEMTNSVNISPEALKGMGNMLATENAAFFFMLPHLKVMEKMATYVPALKRRASIVQSFLQLMNFRFRGKQLAVEPVITPYIINNQAQMFRDLMEQNGGQPLKSQRTTMEEAGIKDIDAEIEQIKAEQELKLSKELL